MKKPIKPITLLCAACLSIILVACKNQDLSTPKTPTISETANSVTPVSPVGTAPAGPTKEAVATTSSEKSDVSKVDQSAAMPLPGQANDHSAIVPKTSEFPKTSP
jgi:hypothetical protein